LGLEKAQEALDGETGPDQQNQREGYLGNGEQVPQTAFCKPLTALWGLLERLGETRPGSLQGRDNPEKSASQEAYPESEQQYLRVDSNINSADDPGWRERAKKIDSPEGPDETQKSADQGEKHRFG
jgi:hypothetical protein